MSFPGHEYGDAADVYVDLRRQILGLTPAQLSAEYADRTLLALLMEARYPAAAVTLVSVADGTTSLYFSNGGGIIGAGAMSPVAAASNLWREAGTKFLRVMPAVTDPPLPNEGEVRFVAVTATGLVAASTVEADLRERRHPLWPLYLAAQNVIAQIRLNEERAGDLRS